MGGGVGCGLVGALVGGLVGCYMSFGGSVYDEMNWLLGTRKGLVGNSSMHGESADVGGGVSFGDRDRC